MCDRCKLQSGQRLCSSLKFHKESPTPSQSHHKQKLKIKSRNIRLPNIKYFKTSHLFLLKIIIITDYQCGRVPPNLE